MEQTQSYSDTGRATALSAAYAPHSESSASAVSWAAVAAGAASAAATALCLLALGSGLGLASISPWANDGASAREVGMGAIAWLVLTQLIAGALGGYLCGRLRTQWVDVHDDEVYFRDTAHGFLAWAVGVIVGAALLASAATAITGGAARIAGGAAAAATGAAVAGAGAVAANASGSDEGAATGYFTDMLLRRPAGGSATSSAASSPATGTTTTPQAEGAAAMPSTPGAAGPAGTRPSTGNAARGEIGRIFVASARAGDVSAPDRAYLSQLVAQETGISQADADKRVTEVVNRVKAAETEARAAADKARKAAAKLAIWTFIALLAGAFVASLSATWGGRGRDRVHGTVRPA